MKTMKITSCNDCLFFQQDTDGWSSDCSYRDKFGVLAVDADDAAISAMNESIPKNCPLKHGGVIVKINE